MVGDTAIFDCNIQMEMYRPLYFVALVFLVLQSACADSDDNHAIQLHSEPTCTRIEIPGYSHFYIETYGPYWETMQCPFDLVFDAFHCDCMFSFRDIAPSTVSYLTPPTTTQMTTTPTTTTLAATTTTLTTTTTIAPPSSQEKPRRRRLLKVLFQLDKIEARVTTVPTITASVKTEFLRPSVLYESGLLSKKSICSGCLFDGGVGYKQHSTDCDKYVMCSPSGQSGSLRADVRNCGVGEYWDQTLLTCRLSKDVPCTTDKCRAKGNWYTYSYPGDCRAYWKCDNGVSIGHCCPKGQGYVNGVGCLPSPSCDTNCGMQQVEQGCGKRSVPGNAKKFRQTIAGHGDIDMDCPAGTVFSADTCDCQTDTKAMTASIVCTKELDLSFSPEVVDVSGKNVHVSGINVTYDNGAVCFHGDGAVVVPRFANAEIGKRLDIDLRFKATEELIGNDLQAVVYNGDCGMDPSIVVGLAKDKVVFKLRNKSNRTSSLTVKLPVKLGSWIRGMFSLQNDVMSMTVDGRTERRLFFGDIDRSRCGLKLGWGKQYANFVGCVDKMSVSFCPTSAT